MWGQPQTVELRAHFRSVGSCAHLLHMVLRNSLPVCAAPASESVHVLCCRRGWATTRQRCCMRQAKRFWRCSKTRTSGCAASLWDLILVPGIAVVPASGVRSLQAGSAFARCYTVRQLGMLHLAMLLYIQRIAQCKCCA